MMRAKHNGLFQNAKIQDLNVIHNMSDMLAKYVEVVSECKDTRFECNSQLTINHDKSALVVSECKDTRFECNSQQAAALDNGVYVVSECKDTRFECNSQPPSGTR